MVFLSALWLPIVLSAVIVFVASSIIHMVLPYHRGNYGGIPGEADVLEAMRKAGVKPGNYRFPFCSSMKEMGSDEMVEKLEAGPVGFANVLPNGQINMGKSLVQWFVLCLVIGLFVAYVTGRTLGPGEHYLAVFRIAGATAFLGHAGAHAHSAIWKGERWGVTAKFIFDGLVYALLTAGTFGWLWPA